MHSTKNRLDGAFQLCKLFLLLRLFFLVATLDPLRRLFVVSSNPPHLGQIGLKRLRDSLLASFAFYVARRRSPSPSPLRFTASNESETRKTCCLYA